MTPGPTGTDVVGLIALQDGACACLTESGDTRTLWLVGGSTETSGRFQDLSRQTCRLDSLLTQGSAPIQSPGATGPFQAPVWDVLLRIETASVSLDLDQIRFFAANTRASGAEPWKTDGTPQGTVLIHDIFPGQASSSPGYFCRYGNRAYFVAEHPSEGRILYQSEGSPGGTHPVNLLDDNNAPFVIPALELVPLERGLVLSTYVPFDRASRPDDIELGFLTRDDRGELNTFTVHELRRGAYGSSPRHLTRVEEQVFFTADDGIHGEELWITDGTAEGTHLVRDILVSGDLSSRNG